MNENATPSLPDTRSQDGLLRVVFTGDVHLGPAYSDEQVFDNSIREACRMSDYVVVNVEGPITNSPPASIPGFILHSSPESAHVLQALGNNVFNLANNHVLDHGLAGLRDTVRFAKERGWSCLGAGANFAEASAPCVLDRYGVTVGILGICSFGVPHAGTSSPGVFGDSMERRVQMSIQELKRRARWVVIVYHGGEEFAHVPLPSRRKRLLRYLSFGADVVVAHHAHCVQRYEKVGDKFLFYGLGNLVFDLAHHHKFPGTDQSVLVSLAFTRESVDYKPLFTRQDRSQRRVLRTPANPHFSRISGRSYARQWEAEAGSRLREYWNNRHDTLPRESRKQKLFYFWKKLRRIGGLLYMCVFDKYGLTRPYIIGGFLYYLRKLFRVRDC